MLHYLSPEKAASFVISLVVSVSLFVLCGLYFFEALIYELNFWYAEYLGQVEYQGHES